MDGEGVETSWWDSVARSFQDQWWVFIITLAIVLGCLLIISIFTKGKIIKVKTIIKIGLHCILGFVLLFVINLFGGIFSWTIVPKWYSWILIGIFGMLGVIFLIVAYFVWPGIFTELAASAS